VLAQNSENNFEGLNDATRADMYIPGGLLFMWGVVSSFLFVVLIADSQKNMILVLRKWKMHFLLDERKFASVAFLAIPRAMRVSDMASF
jgi:hypothetical protein